VSHQPERKEKDCLNCGTTVQGRFCHVCGQENIIAQESFWSLCKHFVYDIFHFDGKFFHTLKYLFTRPGKVAREYCAGKRNRYLHPIRMYLFTSAVFFLLFFALKTNELQIKETPISRETRLELQAELNKELAENPGDTLILHQLSLLKDTTRDVYMTQLDTTRRMRFFLGNSGKYTSLAQYDSLQKKLPAEEKDSWFQKMLTRRGLELNDKYKHDVRQAVNILWTAFLHKLPYMLFFSLPIFAFVLKLIYIRRKNFYYSDHAVFTLYHYIFSFLLLLVIIGVLELQKWTGLGDLDWVALLLVFVWLGYLFAEMKNFYRQGWVKTIVKFLLLDFLGFLIILVLFLAFLLLSLFEI
jgi:hypothetical protein